MIDGHELGWDDCIEDPSEGGFRLLPPGQYEFVVVEMERGRHTPGPNAKITACPKATMTLDFDAGGGGGLRLKHTLFLHSKTQGLIAQFLKGIDMRKHGEPLDLSMLSRCKGRRGVAELGTRTGRDGKTYQDIKRIVEPVRSSQQAAPAAPQGAAAPGDGVPF